MLKRVGVPKGSFYHFFANKHEFGEAVIQNYVEYYARKMSRIFDDESLSPLSRLREFVEDAKRGMLKYGYRRGCLIGNLGQELASLDDAFREQLEAVLVVLGAACRPRAWSRPSTRGNWRPAATPSHFAVLLDRLGGRRVARQTDAQCRTAGPVRRHVLRHAGAYRAPATRQR